MSETRELIKDIVSIEEVLKHLDLGLGKSGRRLQGACPARHAPQGGTSFSVYTTEGFFHCSHCGIAGDVVDLVETVLGLEHREALRWLAERFRPDLLNRLRREGQGPKPDLKAYYQRASLYELVFEHGKKLLFEDEGKNSLEYLVYERGYAPDKLKQTDWMYFPPDLRIRDHLRKVQPQAAEQIKVLKLQGSFEDNFRLAFPYRDRRGAITGFIKWATSPKGISVTTHDGKKHDAVRWDSTNGSDPRDLFNLHACRGEKSLLLVEGYPEAMYFPTQGIKGVAAVGGGQLSRAHVEGLKARGVEMITLCFENDPPDERGEIAGVKNTEKALDLLRGTGIQAFVVPPPSLAPCKDPDQWVKERGIESFKGLLATRVYGSVWRWYRAKSRYELSDLGQWTQAKNEGFGLAEAVTDASERSFLLDTLKKDLGNHGNLFDEALKEHRERQARRWQEAQYRDLHQEMGRLLEEGRLDELGPRLEEKLKELRARDVSRVVEPYTLGRLQEDVLQAPEGLKTGYESLDNTLRIPSGALTIVAARPCQGRTAFLMNLLLNLVSGNPEKSFFFFSLEEARRWVALKLINILGGTTVEEGRNLEQIERYVRGGHTGTPGIEKAKQEFHALTGKGRLWILDGPCIVEDLADTLFTLSEKHEVGAVILDSIEKLKTRAVYPTRRMELRRVFDQLREAAESLRFPWILGARLQADAESSDSLRVDASSEWEETAQEAGLLISVSSASEKKAKEAQASSHDLRVELRLSVLKNRNGPSGWSATLGFDRPTLTVTERGAAPRPGTHPLPLGPERLQAVKASNDSR
jgi:DNA primase catalytic core